MKTRLNRFVVLGLCGFCFAVQGACTPAAQRAQARPSPKEKAELHTPTIRPGSENALLYYIDSRLQKLQSNDAQALESLRQAVSLDMKSSYLHAELARHLAEGNQFEQSILEAEKALKIDPGVPEYHLLRGKLHSVKKNSSQAIQEYESCLKINPDEEDCHIMIAREHLLNENYPQAEKVLNKWLARDPGSTTGWYYLATLYTKQKQFSKAIRAYERVLEEDPEHYKALAALAELHLDQDHPEEALECLLELEGLVPGDVPTKLRIGLLFYEKKNYPEAIKRFSQILELSPDNDRVYYYLGILETQNQNYPQAVTYFKKVPPSSSFYKDALIRLVVVLDETGNTGEAIGEVRKGLKKHKDIPELYELLGSLYAKENQNKKALKAFDEGLKRYPLDEKLLFSKGVVLDKMERFKESMAVMKQILAQNPDNALALNYLGYSYADRGIHLQEALKMLLKANQLKPEDGYITDSLAWAYFKLGEMEKSLKLLEKADRLSPEEPIILEHLGDLHLKMGHREKAKAYFQQAVAAALKTGPKDLREQENLKRIRAKLSALNP